MRVKLSGDGCLVGENGVKVSNKVLAFALIISAIAGEGIREQMAPEAWKQQRGSRSRFC